MQKVMIMADKSHTLPDDVSLFLRELYTAGEHDSVNYYLKLATSKSWSLRKLGTALGISGETVRNRIKDIELNHSCAVQGAPDIPLYEPNRKPKTTDAKKAKYVIPDDVVSEMRKLRDLAAQVSRNTPEDAPSRGASEKLAYIMNKERLNGATYQEIATAACLKSWAAVKFRLGRHGYIELPPSMMDELIIGVYR